MTLTYDLHFRLHKDAPCSVERKYKEVYQRFRDAHDAAIILSWVRHLQENETGCSEDWNVLDCTEGGIGGKCSATDRQIRNATSVERCSTVAYGEIIFSLMDSLDGRKTWNDMEEIQDFLTSFADTLSEQLGCNGGIDSFITIYYASDDLEHENI